MKNIGVAVIVAVAVVASAFIVKMGIENSKAIYSLFGYEGVVYRVNGANGRIDVLVPSSEAALLFPVGQIQLPGAKDQLTSEQKKSFTQNIRTLSQYIQSERARSLGLKEGAASRSKP